MGISKEIIQRFALLADASGDLEFGRCRACGEETGHPEDHRCAGHFGDIWDADALFDATFPDGVTFADWLGRLAQLRRFWSASAAIRIRSIVAMALDGAALRPTDADVQADAAAVRRLRLDSLIA